MDGEIFMRDFGKETFATLYAIIRIQYTINSASESDEDRALQLAPVTMNFLALRQSTSAAICRRSQAVLVASHTAFAVLDRATRKCRQTRYYPIMFSNHTGPPGFDQSTA